VLLAPPVLPSVTTALPVPAGVPAPMLMVWVLPVVVLALPMLMVFVAVDWPRVRAPVWVVPPTVIVPVDTAVPSEIDEALVPPIVRAPE